MKKQLALLLTVTLTLSLIFGCIFATNAESTVPEDRVYVEMDTAQEYSEYLTLHGNADVSVKEIILEATAYSDAEQGLVEVYSDYEGMSGNSLYTSESGYVEWKVEIAEAGYYCIKVEYYPVEGRSASIQRSIMIDGEIPFEEVRTVVFDRVWVDVAYEDGNTIKTDRNGNQIRPQQTEAPCWREQYVTDHVGYETKPLKFWFSAGVHTIRFISVREPMLIKRIILCTPEEINNYADLKSNYELNGYTAGSGEAVKYQAEQPSAKSDSTIVPSFDRSSASSEPNDPFKLCYNTIGGSSMQQNGQWLEWKFTVPEDGLYTITFKAVQNTSNGSVSSRRIYIDGEVPCKELENVKFPYSLRWSNYTLGEKNEDYSFYLKAGVTHILKMEVVLGESAPLIREISNSVDKLNRIYRDILVVTGPIPDINRDYQFDKILPEVIEEIKNQAEIIKNVYDKLCENSGMSGENVQTLAKMYRQLEKMHNDPEIIAEQFSTLQSNITAMATWVSSALEQPLTLDYFVVSPAGSEIPKSSVSVWEQVKFQIGCFISSFTEDYNSIDSDDSENAVKVWVGSGMTGGRDQAQILKNLINNYFTPQSGIKVNVSLVSMGSLLPASLAGKGPDVALSLGATDIANYAFRNAAEDISKYDGFDEVSSWFNESALTPLSFEGGVYGIPETQTYPVMFYRKDILSELGVDIPQTWDDVIRIIPVLQKKQLNFGLPTSSGTGTSLTAYAMLLFQNGGALYTEDGSKSLVNSEISLETFAFLTMLYTDYDLDQVLDFANRFRSGEIPIGIVDYSLYNQLSVFAPELEGIWEITTVPGVKKGNGVIDRSVPANVSACMLLSKSQNKDKAWEFMKWWCSNDIQVKFGRELESVMGTAARYPTANTEALYQIPWSESVFNVLIEQGKWTKAIPEVPGSYYTSRYIDFAFRDVINLDYDVGEALAEAEKSINFELESKRKEFGLSVD